jgi:hypothetical protein
LDFVIVLNKPSAKRYKRSVCHYSVQIKPKSTFNSLVLLVKKVSKITTAKFSQYQQHSWFPYFYWQISFMFSKATTISYQQYNSFPYFYGQMRLASSQLPNSSHINSTLKLHYSYWQNKISEESGVLLVLAEFSSCDFTDLFYQ